MKFTYRGTHYEREPITLLEVTEGEIGGKYRGQNWRTQYPRHIPHIQPKVHLIYRGVSYSTRPVIKSSETVATPQVAIANDSTTPAANKPEKVLDEVSKAHLESLHRNLEHRLQVAKASGNEDLVHQLEDESKHLLQV